MYKLWNTLKAFINDFFKYLFLFTFRMVALNNTKDSLKWTIINTIKTV